MLMRKSYLKAVAAISAILVLVLMISIYDSEELAEPIIGYSEASTQIPLDSIWEETESQTDESKLTVTETTFLSTEDRTESNSSDAVLEQSYPININTATVEELKQLKGIGDVIAARIVEYAQTTGFDSIEDIKNVKGIGDKKFEIIKDKITVS